MNVDIPLWAAIPASILLVAGGLLALVGSAGLLRFNNFHCRIHAPTLGNTMGAGCVLLASILVFSALQHRLVVHEVMITLLLLITSPITAMLLMRAAVYRGRRKRGESYPTATSPRTRYGRTDL
ncbi:MAG TPA: monovalent cation/H(+) antiporter subunit G [Bordetella sp.]|nr:monovalent cation/H(+) antiporter subunit G [Bordetella sp.]